VGGLQRFSPSLTVVGKECLRVIMLRDETAGPHIRCPLLAPLVTIKKPITFSFSYISIPQRGSAYLQVLPLLLAGYAVPRLDHLGHLCPKDVQGLLVPRQQQFRIACETNPARYRVNMWGERGAEHRRYRLNHGFNSSSQFHERYCGMKAPTSLTPPPPTTTTSPPQQGELVTSKGPPCLLSPMMYLFLALRYPFVLSCSLPWRFIRSITTLVSRFSSSTLQAGSIPR